MFFFLAPSVAGSMAHGGGGAIGGFVGVAIGAAARGGGTATRIGSRAAGTMARNAASEARTIGGAVARGMQRATGRS
jgi:hypothetical protein